MANVKEMAEAHLRNVQQQIVALEEQKKKIEEEVVKLTEYLQQGVGELNVETTENEKL